MSTPCQIKIAYRSHALASSPTYVDYTAYANQVTVRRGRTYLTDRIEAGTCDIQFSDTDGTLDPTNSGSTAYPMDPNCPAQVYLRNPVTTNLVQIYQGLTQDCPQTVRSEGAAANRGTISLIDLFSLLALRELPPSVDFDSSSAGTNTANTAGDTTYAEQTVQDRIKAILADAGVPSGLTNIFTGNVRVQQTVYAPGYATLAALQDAADAEFPGVANIYVDKTGVVTFHGRLARFNSGAGNPYGISTWKAGSREAVASDSTLALLFADDFVLDRDVNKIINNALFCPRGIADADIAGQLVTDTTSITDYGPRSITGMDLLTAGGTTGTPNAGLPLAETKMFGTFYIDNFAFPQTRIAQATFRPVRLSAANASAHWSFICNVELNDVIEITAATPHGTGFVTDPYFVEGLEYTIELGGSDIPNVTLVLDLSPASYFTTEPTHWDGT